MKSAGTVAFLLAVALLAPLRGHAQEPPAPPPPPAEAEASGAAPARQPATSAMPANEPPARHAKAHQPTAPQAPEAVKPLAPKPVGATDDEGTHAEEHQERATAWPTAASVFGTDFMRWALLAGLLVTSVCAYVGVYVVLKRIVFVGVALAEVSSAGVALAMLAGFNPFLGAVVLMLAGIGLFSVRWAPRRVAREPFIGVGWAVASAVGVLLIAKNASGEAHMHDLLFGNILTVNPVDVRHTALGLCLVLVLHALFSKEFLFVSFDADTAVAMGYRARLWDLLLMASIGLAIAFSIHTVGVLLAFSALVLPGVAALLLTRRMKHALAASVAVGVIPVPIGLYLSFARDLPSSAVIVVVMFGLLLMAGLVSRFQR